MKQKYPVLILVTGLIFIAGCTVGNKRTGETTERQSNYIKVASFNIQIFGQSKISDPKIMDVLARIVKRYDVVAIQEVRSVEENVIPLLLSYINKGDIKYDYVISKRLGRTGSKEQYAFIYNAKTVSLISNGSYVVDDPEDVFEREPFVAYFRSGNFDFKLINNHIKPEDVKAEFKRLAVVINNIYDNSSEKDIIVLGDMNADGSYFNENNLAATFPSWIQLIGNNEDTTVAASNNTYDRMMTRDTTANVEYTGKAGVFRWDTEYEVTDAEFIKKVSDHYPIYAEFRTDLPDDD